MPRSNYKKICSDMMREAQARANARDGLVDEHVERLGDLYGYGALMSAAARIWRRKVGGGAFVVGPCYDTLAAEMGEEQVGYTGPPARPRS